MNKVTKRILQPEGLWVGSSEACQLLHCTDRTLRRKRKKYHLETRRIPGQGHSLHYLRHEIQSLEGGLDLRVGIEQRASYPYLLKWHAWLF